MVGAVGPHVLTPTLMFTLQIKSFWGGVKHFPQIEESRMLDKGGLPDVCSKHLDSTELECGNHQRANQHDERIWDKVVADVKMGRTILFEASRARAIKRLRVSPLLGVVQGSAGVSIPERPQPRTVGLPSGRDQLPGADGGPGDVFFARYNVGNGILVEVQWFKDGRRCIRATQPLVLEYFRLLDDRGPRATSLLSSSKTSEWNVTIEVLVVGSTSTILPLA